MNRRRGLSARSRLTLSYAGLVLVAGGLLLAVVWAFLLRYVPEGPIHTTIGGFVPNRGDLARAFVPPAAAAMGALLVFGLGGGWFLAGRMLAPLTRMTATTRAVTAGDLTHRMDLPGRQDEFRELADAFDAMLERIEAHVAEQQRFAANASHELRTPLAITKTILDVARADPAVDARDLVERLGVLNDRAIDLTEALLVLSRADQRAFVRERVDLSLLVEEAHEALLPLAEARAVTFDIEGGDAATVGSRALLGQLVTNLLHNAIVHNAGGGTVRVRTRSASGSVLLEVESGGAPIDPATVSTLTERFQRGTARVRRSDHAGVGLGLAIVDSIVRAHDGVLTLAARHEGGLAVTVRLPAA